MPEALAWSQGPGGPGGLRPVLHGQLPVDAAEVTLDGLLPDVQRGRYLAVAQPIGYERQHLAFPATEAVAAPKNLLARLVEGGLDEPDGAGAGHPHQHPSQSLRRWERCVASA